MVKNDKFVSVPFLTRLLLASTLFAGSLFAEETLNLVWPDLQGQVGEFEDPFTALDSDQLFHLGMVARLRAMQQADPDAFPAEDAAELAKFTTDLEDGGIDIDGLLAKREEITNLRRQRANSTRTDYEGKTIRMPGYLLPLDITEGEVSARAVGRRVYPHAPAAAQSDCLREGIQALGGAQPMGTRLR